MSQKALPGFRDFYPEEFAQRAYIMNTWRDVARRFAFVEYDGPPLESLELYTRKSGDEIVGQLYHFTDKGGREVALRPEMTPTVARMVAARANALRKPVRWFSMPQLFRYERQQKGRLREHFQLNVDILGEADVTADAELAAVAVEVMRAFGLTAADVKLRFSDRRLINALLVAVGVTDAQLPAAYAAIDKMEKISIDAFNEMLAAGGITADAQRRIAALMTRNLAALASEFGGDPAIAAMLATLERYLGHLAALGVAAYAELDLRIVRGLAYYTGIVFELFDAQGEFRAICGGGRYDTLLAALGGADLPALGFGLGDVVLGDLLRARGLMPTALPGPDFWVIGTEQQGIDTVMGVAHELRAKGFGVEYALKAQSASKQQKAAHSANARFVLHLDDAFGTNRAVTVRDLRTPAGKESIAPEGLTTLDRMMETVATNRDRIF
jgi:histidyl-tRNA synthetase